MVFAVREVNGLFGAAIECGAAIVEGREPFVAAVAGMGFRPNLFGGVKVGGIRIAAVSGIDAPRRIMLTTTRSKRAETIIETIKETNTENQAQ